MVHDFIFDAQRIFDIIVTDLNTQFGSNFSLGIYFDCNVFFGSGKHETKMKKKKRYTYINDYIITLCTQ